MLFHERRRIVIVMAKILGICCVLKAPTPRSIRNVHVYRITCGTRQNAVVMIGGSAAGAIAPILWQSHIRCERRNKMLNTRMWFTQCETPILATSEKGRKDFNLICRFPSHLRRSTSRARLATRSATIIPIFHCQYPPVNDPRCQALTLRHTHCPLPRGKLCYSPDTHLDCSLGWFGISEYRIEGIHWARQRIGYSILARSNSEMVDRRWEWCNRSDATHVV